MPTEMDPSERDRLLRDADAELESLRRARPRPRRRFYDDTWMEAILGPLIHGGSAWLTKVLVIVVGVVVLLSEVCSG